MGVLLRFPPAPPRPGCDLDLRDIAFVIDARLRRPFYYPLCHGACNNPASPAPSLPPRILPPAVVHTAAPRHCAFGQHRTSCPAAAAPLRWPAINLARQLAACRRLPRHILRHARGFATGFVPLCVPPYPHRRLLPWPCTVPAARRLHRQLRSRLRRLHRGARFVRCAQLHTTGQG